MLLAHHRLFHYGIILSDLCLLTASLYASSRFTLADRFLPSAAEDATAKMLMAQILLIGLAWVFMAIRGGVYQSWRTGGRWRELTVLFEAILLAIAVGTVLALAFHGKIAFQPLAAIGFSVASLGVLRLVTRSVLAKARSNERNYRRVLIVGRSRSVQTVLERIDTNPAYGIRVVGGLHLPSELDHPLPSGLQDLGSSHRLCEFVTELNVDRVLFCPSAKAGAGESQTAMDLCDEAGIPWAYVPNFVAARNLNANASWLGELPLFTFSSVPTPSFQLAVKRGMDVLGAMTGILLTLPVQIACALAVKLTDGGPMLFKQVRVGAAGQRFHCYKFRSMRVDADEMKKELEDLNEQDGPVFKIAKDPRITRVGHFLRKYSLDELPQLYNVLFGDMSLVGPRPPVPDEVSRYEWWQRKRISVRPGITCIWQVWGRNKVSFQRWVEMDLYYINNWSLWLDIKLLLHTVRTVVRGTGS